MRKSKKLSLSKMTITKLSRNEQNSIYGGTIDKGCDPKSKGGPGICPETDDCDHTVRGPQCD